MIVTVSRHHFCLQYQHVYDSNWCCSGWNIVVCWDKGKDSVAV